MRNFLLAVIAVPLVFSAVCHAGDFGKEANKSSVSAKKKLMLMRVNEVTGEKVLFSADKVDLKKVAGFAKVEDGDAAKSDFLRATTTQIEESQKGVQLASKSETAGGPTTAWWGWYYGSYVVTYVYIRYYVYYPYYCGGYVYYWLW